MLFTKIEAFDLPALWFQVLKECLEHGYLRPVFRGSRQNSRRLELDNASLIVKMPSQRPLEPQVPKGVPPPTSMKYIQKYLRYLITPYKEKWEEYTYGERMVSMIHIDKVEGQRMSALDFNQLDKVIEFLKETPETNRGVIEIGKAEDLILKHPPCMRLLQFKVRYGKLHLFVYFRSWDAWGGLPANLGALQLVKEYVGRQIKVEDGQIFAWSPGLHLYDSEWELAKRVISGKGIK